MNYDQFLAGIVDELDKHASEEAPGEMLPIEEAFFVGLLDELEKSAGWRDLGAAKRSNYLLRAKKNIGKARAKAAKNLLSSGGKTTGSGAFTSAAEGGSLRFGRVKGTDKATVGRVRSGGGRFQPGKAGAVEKIKGVGTRQIGQKKLAPSVESAGQKVKSRPMSGWGATNWKDRQAAQQKQTAKSQADPLGRLKQKLEMRRAARASGREDVARFRKMEAASSAKPTVASAGAKVRERNIQAGRFGPQGGPASARKPGILERAYKAAPTTAASPKPPVAPGWAGRLANKVRGRTAA